MGERSPIIFIVMTMVIDAMGIGLIMPVTPDLIQEIQGTDISNAAIWGGVLGAGFAAMQFLFSPFLGSLSDRYGRRPVLLISLLSMSAVYFIMAIAGSIWVLLIARFLGGITAATQACAAAYMADISSAKDKAKNFGLIGAGFGMGFVLGPVVGGLLAEYGTRAPFYAAAILAAANCVFGWLVMKESVTDEIRRPFELSRANPLGALRSISKFPGLRPLLLVFFFYQIATMVYPAIWAYFTAERYAWSPSMIGFSLALFGLFYAMVQGLLVGPATQRLGNQGTVVAGLTFEVFALIALAFIVSGTWALILVPIAAFAAIGVPALQGIMSSSIPDDAQGELQGVLSSVTSIAMILSPLAMTQMFAYFSGPNAPVYLPGAPFLLAAGLMVVGLFILLATPASRTEIKQV